MKLGLIMYFNAFLLGVLLLLPDINAGVVSRKRRQTQTSEVKGGAVDVSKLMSRKDLKRLESAVKAEIEASGGDESILTPEKLDQLVEEHSQNLPWYKRLLKRFTDALPEIIQAVARTILQDVLVPALSAQFKSG